MPSNDRGGLKAAFTNFGKVAEAEREAERMLLGREAVHPQEASAQPRSDFQVAETQLPGSGGLTPRPLLNREPVRQLSFRCPHSLAAELRRKAAFNQLEQQEIIIEGLRRVLIDLSEPPEGWER